MVTTMGKNMRSAGVVVLRKDKKDVYRILCLQCHPHWDIPKGQIDEEEVPFQTAKRELKEETGLASKDVRYFKNKAGKVVKRDLPYILKNSGKRKIVRLYLAETKATKISLSKEHQNCKWLKYEDAKMFLPPRFKGLMRWIAPIMNKEVTCVS